MVFTTMTLLLLEGALRLAWTPPPGAMTTTLQSRALFRADPDLGWRMVPDLRIDYHWHFGATTRIATNSLGFRDIEHGREPAPGVPRVLVLGDSHAFGYGVADDRTFASLLRATLPRAEILNLAVTGYNPRQCRALLEREGLSFRPAVVAFAFCLNDVTSQEIPAAAAVTAAPRRSPGLADRSYLVRFVREQVNSNHHVVRALVALRIKDELGGYELLDPNVRPALREYPPELAREWEETRAEMRRIRDDCAAAGAKLLVVPIPAVQTVDEDSLERCLAYVRFTRGDFDLAKPYRELGAFCAAEGVPCIETYAPFVERRRAGEALHFRYDLHINEAGHRLLAELLRPRLEEMLGLAK